MRPAHSPGDLDAWIRIEAAPRPSAPAVFIDRDGTIIENSPYLSDPEGVVPIAGAREAMAAYRAAGFAIVMVTNQSGIARGLCSVEQYRAVEARVLDHFGPGLIDVVYACPFHPDGEQPFAIDHAWRKPRPGMLIDAAARFGLDMARSIMIGDSLCDVQAGVAAGAGTAIHVLTGHGLTERAAVEAYAKGIVREPGTPLIRYAASVGEATTIECAA